MRRRSLSSSVITALFVAGATGSIVGIATDAAGRRAITRGAAHFAIATGLKRAREPQPGDRWGGCNDARAAGTAPIYRGEPGYRPNMDGDDDGIACEPYR
jgi:hypothetical protein